MVCLWDCLLVGSFRRFGLVAGFVVVVTAATVMFFKVKPLNKNKYRGLSFETSTTT